MLRRRTDDWAIHAAPEPPSAPGGALHRAGLGWLGEVVSAGAASTPGPAAAPHPGAARREWLRDWRRLQLPDRMAEYGEQLNRARGEGDVYRALTEHAVRIVGGYLCLVFLPQDGRAPLAPLPHERLRCDPAALRIAEPPAAPGVIDAAAAEAAGPFSALHPLFRDEGAALLALAPLGAVGTVVLVERRGERSFGVEDWELLRIVSAQAEAALERVRLWERIDTLAQSDPVTGLAGAAHARAVLAHAARVAEWGEPVSVAILGVDGLGGAALCHGPAEAERLVRAVAEVVRHAAGERGIVLRQGGDELLLVLPGMKPDAAALLVAAARERLARRVAVHAGIVEHTAAAVPVLELVNRARAAMPPSGRPAAAR
ncbi:MAG TPA: GGDEF domain-containing protein [Longimicrobium sp.]|nr:GGDEF domain-containing protein [Longimicrobium sp.]